MLAILLGFLVSCQTVNHDIPAGAAPEIYFQKAQAETDLSHYDQAIDIYRLFLSVATESDTEEVLSARFEIALLEWKQNNITQATKDFQAILADFQDVAKSAKYPTWVKVLSQKKLQEIQGSDAAAPKS